MHDTLNTAFFCTTDILVGLVWRHSVRGWVDWSRPSVRGTIGRLLPRLL